MKNKGTWLVIVANLFAVGLNIVLCTGPMNAFAACVNAFCVGLLVTTFDI